MPGEQLRARRGKALRVRTDKLADTSYPEMNKDEIQADDNGPDSSRG